MKSTNIQYSFEGRSVVVTGGAQGIGLQISRDFLAAGARVAIWDYSADALEAARAELMELGEFGERVQLTRTDVTQSASCRAAAALLKTRTDILVNNAGITRDKSLAKMTEEEFQAVIQTNLTGLFLVTKSLLENFNPASAHRRIINLASVVALYGNFGQSNYVAAKAGVIGMTRTWARELGRKQFTVNAIAPGFIQTAMVAKMPEDALRSLSEKVPVGRLGLTRDISNACLFLASEEASYINGTVLSVDGGLVP